MTAIDFHMPPAIAFAWGHALLFPLWLAASGRVPAWRESHALRFFGCAVLVVAAWAASALAFSGFAQPADELVAGLCLVLGAVLFYLQVWGLLTRGYTLALLATLLDARRPLTEREMFDGYRGGEGLEWIMRHRIGGLAASGFLLRDGDAVTLGSGRAVLVVRLYRLCTRVLGLRRTG